MNKAFTRESEDEDEDDDTPESASPLPAGSKNYMTPAGFARLRTNSTIVSRGDRNLLRHAPWAPVMAIARKMGTTSMARSASARWTGGSAF